MPARIRRLLSILAVIAALTPLSAGAAHAEPSGTIGESVPLGDTTVVSKLSLEQLQSVLRSEGYTFSLTERKNVLWKIDGVSVLLYVGKTSVSCWVSYSDLKPSLEKINAWNREMRFSTAFLDADGDPCLELDLDLEGGVTVARVKDYLKTCRQSIARWTEKIAH
ncbi:MAG: YbjN domain-containing protein [Proteobacteria bacterium]|nr:YbjN domain-containing protein [Pseudomonadota bacterium]